MRHLILFFMLCLFTQACASGGRIVVYKGQDIDDTTELGIPNRNLILEDYFDHPATLESELLRDELGRVQYKENKILGFSWSAAKPIFTERQSSVLSRELPKALGLADNRQVVLFHVKEKISHRTVHTRGAAFVIGTNLHLVFFELRQGTGDNKSYLPEGVQWKVVAEQNQKLFSTKVLNRLVIPLVP